MADKANILKGLDHFLSNLPIGASLTINVSFDGVEPEKRVKTKKSSKVTSQYKLKNNHSVLNHSEVSVCDSDTAYSMDLRTDRLFPPAQMVTSAGIARAKKSISDL